MLKKTIISAMFLCTITNSFCMEPYYAKASKGESDSAKATPDREGSAEKRNRNDRDQFLTEVQSKVQKTTNLYLPLFPQEIWVQIIDELIKTANNSNEMARLLSRFARICKVFKVLVNCESDEFVTKSKKVCQFIALRIPNLIDNQIITECFSANEKVTLEFQPKEFDDEKKLKCIKPSMLETLKETQKKYLGYILCDCCNMNTNLEAKNRINILKMILNKMGYYDINFEDENFQTALVYAVEYQNQEDITDALEIGDQLIKAILKVTSINVNCGALIAAAWGDNYFSADTLLKISELDVNEKDEDGDTALKAAVLGSSVKLVKVLLDDARLNVNLQDNFGNTALMNLISHMHGTEGLRMLKMLLAHKDIDLNLKNNDGQTAFDIAQANGVPENVIQILQNPDLAKNLDSDDESDDSDNLENE